VLPWLDRWLYRHPFEGASARRYAAAERPAFADLDERLLDGMTPLLGDARRLLDVGCGPCTFALRAAARWPELEVIALDPSRDFTHRTRGCASCAPPASGYLLRRRPSTSPCAYLRSVTSATGSRRFAS
jgi:hypothetical protein